MKGWLHSPVKRGMDLCVASVAIFFAWPFFVLAALAIRAESSGPIFFRQLRLGKNGMPFWLFKFRTMTDKPRSVSVEILAGNPEVTRIGHILRRTKIDETPQLLNVFRGEMSLVGPRPAMPEQLNEYDAYARRRLEAKPGLTGLAQVNGNIFISWPERWRLDVQYVESASFWLDVRIIAKTILVIFLGEHRFAQQKGKNSCV